MYNVHGEYKIQSNVTNVQKDTTQTLMHTIVLSSQSAPMSSHELETLVKLNRMMGGLSQRMNKRLSFFFEHECIFV